MKKLVITFFSIALISSGIFAQTTIKPTIGINFTDMSVTDGSAKGKVGALFGGSIAFGKRLYIEPGVYWVQKTTDITSSGSVSSLDAKLKGIRVPVSIGMHLIGNEKTVIALRGFGGASGFFITSVSSDIDKNSINTTSWGVFAGAGLDLWKIFLDLSYEWSATNVQKDVSQIDIGKTKSLFINAGLRINL